MRALFAVLFIFLTFETWAQSKRDDRFRLQFGAMVSYSVGKFHANTNRDYPLGVSKYGTGGSLAVLKPIAKGFGIGVFASSMFVFTDPNALEAKMYQRYDAGNNFLTVEQRKTFGLTHIGIEVFQSFYFGTFTVEPIMRIGLGNLTDVGDIHVRVKKRNDNYFDEYTLHIKGADEFSFPYYSLGLRATAPVGEWFNVFTTAIYSGGTFKYKISEEHTNLFRDIDYSEYRLTQPLSSIQINFGLEFRFGRR